MRDDGMIWKKTWPFWQTATTRIQAQFFCGSLRVGRQSRALGQEFDMIYTNLNDGPPCTDKWLCSGGHMFTLILKSQPVKSFHWLRKAVISSRTREGASQTGRFNFSGWCCSIAWIIIIIRHYQGKCSPSRSLSGFLISMTCFLTHRTVCLHLILNLHATTTTCTIWAICYWHFYHYITICGVCVCARVYACV